MSRGNPAKSEKDIVKTGILDDLHRVTKSELPAIADVLADAFQNDPFNGYLFPDVDVRYKAFRILYGIMLHLMYYTSEIHATSEKLEGVLVIGISRKKGDKGKDARHTGMQMFFGIVCGILRALALPYPNTFRIKSATASSP